MESTDKNPASLGKEARAVCYIRLRTQPPFRRKEEAKGQGEKAEIRALCMHMYAYCSYRGVSVNNQFHLLGNL